MNLLLPPQLLYIYASELNDEKKKENIIIIIIIIILYKRLASSAEKEKKRQVALSTLSLPFTEPHSHTHTHAAVRTHTMCVCPREERRRSIVRTFHCRLQPVRSFEEYLTLTKRKKKEERKK